MRMLSLQEFDKEAAWAVGRRWQNKDRFKSRSPMVVRVYPGYEVSGKQLPSGAYEIVANGGSYVYVPEVNSWYLGNFAYDDSELAKVLFSWTPGCTADRMTVWFLDKIREHGIAYLAARKLGVDL